MSDDLQPTTEKDDLTERRRDSKSSLRHLVPDGVAQMFGTAGDDHSTPASRQGSISRRHFVLLASGVTAMVVGSSASTATPRSTTVTQPDAFGYGGDSAGPGGGATTVAAGRAASAVTETEDNDERATAMEIPTGTLVEAELDPATVDWFTFDATADDPITVDYERSAAVGVTGLILYGPGGEFINQLYVGTETLHQLTATATEAGSYFLQVVDVEDGDGPYTVTVRLEEPDAGDTKQSPYFDSPATIPGRVQAQNFDNGGQDVAYYDTSSENQGGEYRPDEYVDIERSDDGTNEYAVSYLQSGEWLEYTVDATAGTYTLNARVATDQSGREYEVRLGGDLLTTVNPPDTGGAWETVTVTGVDVPSGGTQQLRVDVTTDGGSLNWLEFVDETDSTYGTQAYGEYEYGG